MSFETINQYIEDNIKDRRPEKVSADNIRTALLGITEVVGEMEPALEEGIHTNVEVGGIASGTDLPETMTLTEFVKALVRKVYTPAITAPSFSLSHNAGALRKIGTTVNVQLTFAFNRGSIQSGWNNTTQGARAGAATGYTFTKADNSNYDNQPQVGNVFTATGMR